MSASSGLLKLASRLACNQSHVLLRSTNWSKQLSFLSPCYTVASSETKGTEVMRSEGGSPRKALLSPSRLHVHTHTVKNGTTATGQEKCPLVPLGCSQRFFSTGCNLNRWQPFDKRGNPLHVHRFNMLTKEEYKVMYLAILRPWPRPFRKRKILSKIQQIRQEVDPEFDMERFIMQARSGVGVVSHAISEGKLDELEGQLTKDAMVQAKDFYNNLASEERKWMAVNPTDIPLGRLDEIIIDSEKKQLEITLVFVGGHNLSQKGRTLGRKNMYLCYYRFIKKYEKGEKYPWTVGAIFHGYLGSS